MAVFRPRPWLQLHPASSGGEKWRNRHRLIDTSDGEISIVKSRYLSIISTQDQDQSCHGEMRPTAEHRLLGYTSPQLLQRNSPDDQHGEGGEEILWVGFNWFSLAMNRKKPRAKSATKARPPVARTRERVHANDRWLATLIRWDPAACCLLPLGRAGHSTGSVSQLSPAALLILFCRETTRAANDPSVFTITEKAPYVGVPISCLLTVG